MSIAQGEWGASARAYEAADKCRKLEAEVFNLTSRLEAAERQIVAMWEAVRPLIADAEGRK